MRGERIGTLTRTVGCSCSFAYEPGLLSRLEPGTPLLSHSLPLRGEPYGPSAARPFFEGLLPHGPHRRRLAGELGVHPEDAFALLAELGGDCPGAVTFLPGGIALQPREPASLAWVEEGELEELLSPAPARLLDPATPRRMRFALSGGRHKLALVRDGASGRWAWPEPGVASTHIVKPASAGRPDLLANEMAFTTAWREIGLPVAHAELTEIAGHRCLVSKRFDRWGEGPGAERLHQESLSQALGVAPPPREGSGRPERPTLAESSALLRESCEERDVEMLMLASVCNAVLGNFDSHGPNCALLHAGGRPLLAPFYDIASTEAYGDRPPRRRRAFGGDLPPAPLLVDFATIAAECGYGLEPALIAAVEAMGRLTVALGRVAERAQEEGWYEPIVDEALQRIADRALGFREEMEYLRPPGG